MRLMDTTSKERPDKPARLAAAAEWVLFATGALVLARAAWQLAYSPSMDYGVVVEMARNMAAGADFPAFFYGQAYMGSLEPAMSALVCLLFGPHPFCVCLGTAAFAMAALFAGMRMARRLGGRAAACIAGALMTCGGTYWLHFMASPRGGYSLATLLALLAIGICANGDFVDSATGKVRRRSAAWLGLLAGLAFWNNWLALPAFAAGGATLLWRLRARLLSWRFLCPAAAAFLAGSAPWWLFALRHGLAALSLEAGPAPLGLRGLAVVRSVVLPEFFGYGGDAAAFARSPIAIALVTAAACAMLDAVMCRAAGVMRKAARALCQVGAQGRAAGALRQVGAHDAATTTCRDPLAGSRSPRSAERFRFFATTLAFCVLFLFAYSFSSFGATRSARYFAVLVPPCAVAVASALGAALQGACGLAHAPPAGGRRAAPALRACYALPAIAAVAIAAGAADSFRRSMAFLSEMSEGDAAWAEAVRAAAEDPALSQPAFADFRHFGVNWASGRRLCFASPLRWRYDPYLERLEDAEAPVVIDDFLNFSAFCAATGGKCRTRCVASFRVADRIKAPPALREIPAASVSGATHCGAPARDALFDSNLATALAISGGAGASVEVEFGAPVAIAGIRGVVTHSSAAYGWRAEAVAEDGSAQLLARENPRRGWFWSGPRPYLYGPDSAWELRWRPVKAARLRITFEGRDGGGAGAFSVAVAELVPLSPERLPRPDIQKIAAAVEEAGVRGARLHAPRWIARHLGADPDPALKFGAASASLALPGVCQFATIDFGGGGTVVMDPGAADAAEGLLARHGVDFSRMEAGGRSVVAVRPWRGDGHAPRIRFYGCRLLLDEDSDDRAPAKGEVTFGDAWKIAPAAPPPPKIAPGEEARLRFRVSGAERCGVLKRATLFVHAVQGGRVVAVGGIDIDGSQVLVPADDPRPVEVEVAVRIPRDAAAGKLEFMACVTPQGGRVRLAPCGAGVVANRRRAAVGTSEVSAGEPTRSRASSQAAMPPGSSRR